MWYHSRLLRSLSTDITSRTPAASTLTKNVLQDRGYGLQVHTRPLHNAVYNITLSVSSPE